MLSKNASMAVVRDIAACGRIRRRHGVTVEPSKQRIEMKDSAQNAKVEIADNDFRRMLTLDREVK